MSVSTASNSLLRWMASVDYVDLHDHFHCRWGQTIRIAATSRSGIVISQYGVTDLPRSSVKYDVFSGSMSFI